MSGSSYGQTLRSPTSSSSEASASSTPKSLKEGSNRTSWDTTLKSEDIHQSSPNGREEYAREERWSRHDVDMGVEELEPRRRRQRNSGGFLLDSLQSPIHRTGHTNGNSTEKGKGKEEALNSHIVRSKTRQHATHRPKPSIGSSPLATKVTNAISHQDQDHNKSVPSASTTSRKNHNLVDVLPMNPAQVNSGTKSSPDDEGPTELSKFVTDPAQIVNLALNLSESRRRQFSMGRMSPLDPVTNRRVIPSSQLGSRHSSSIFEGPTGGNLKGHLQQQQRYSSRNFASKIDKVEPAQASSPQSRSSQEQTRNYELPVAPSLGLDLVNDLDLTPSDATLLRAERAQLFLELGYEYRRLLQYLPKLPTPSRHKSDTSKGSGRKTSETPEMLGRSYNPIQFIRNRKARRGHDRKTYNAEAEGWKNVLKVRGWVDAVAEEREDRVSKVDDKFPLPSFRIKQEESTAEGPSPPSSVGHSRGLTATTVARPRSDWITTPWDMLADAYWLDQDDNKRLIEDRDGNKLYQPKKASGEPSPRLSQELVRSATRRSESMVRPNQSPNKVSPMVIDAHDDKERGRMRHRFRDSISSLQDYGGSQDRSNRWQRRLIRSRSSSSSGSSVPGSLNRLRLARDHRDSRERQDSAVLEKQVMDLLAKEAENLDWGSSENVNDTGFNLKNVSGTMPNKQNEGATQNHKSHPVKLENAHVQNDHGTGTRSKDKRASLEEPPEKRGRKPRTSFEYIDTTAPNSPTGVGFVPRFAINLSPPVSRSPSPKKLLSFNHSRSRDERSKERHAIDHTDFAVETESTTNRPRKVLTNAYPPLADKELPTGSSDGLLSPKSAAEGVGRILRHRRSESKSERISKDQKEPESRLRVLVKGGRLAEIIGNEVSRVGDLFWRKDGSNHGSRIASPASSYASDISESEEEIPATSPKKRLGNSISSINNNEEATKKLSRKLTNEDSPKYFTNNLPSFKSPLRKEESDTDIVRGDDHITRQQLALRDKGRPNRFDRLAPPNLDMRGVSSSPSPPGLGRVITYDTDVTYDGSRRNSANPSETSAGHANRQFNAIRGLPDKIGNGGPPVTGLANLDIRRRRSAERPKLEGNRQWSISDRGVSAVRGNVTNRDITRARALLLSSGVKANEIVRRAWEICDPPSLILQDLQRTMKSPLPRVPRSQEFMLAGGLLVKNIAETNKRIRDTADKFSDIAVIKLHDRIKAIDEHITSQLTPSLRASADDADSLGTELATSHRLNVKRLNDSIDVILRQKRRRFRWVRRGGYLLLEWMLLGAMWWVWLIVVIVRLVRGTVSGVYRGMRWLLWL